jgi:hypothetical protein
MKEKVCRQMHFKFEICRRLVRVNFFIRCLTKLLMKKAYLITASLILLVISGVSCAKHSWKETQVLHEGMHEHDKAAAPGHDAPAAPHAASEHAPGH